VKLWQILLTVAIVLLAVAFLASLVMVAIGPRM
jgi:hypothetical protein